MKIIYIADDGKEFDDKWKCLDYEWMLSHPHLKDIVLYSEEDEILDDLFDQETYEYVMKIIVPTDEAACDLRELGERNGWCAYEYIESAGTWIWEGLNSSFVKVD